MSPCASIAKQLRHVVPMTIDELERRRPNRKILRKRVQFRHKFLRVCILPVFLRGGKLVTPIPHTFLQLNDFRNEMHFVVARTCICPHGRDTASKVIVIDNQFIEL
jgi:hypothetical protein